jgi:hypothetical protein
MKHLGSVTQAAWLKAQSSGEHSRLEEHGRSLQTRRRGPDPGRELGESKDGPKRRLGRGGVSSRGPGQGQLEKQRTRTEGWCVTLRQVAGELRANSGVSTVEVSSDLDTGKLYTVTWSKTQGQWRLEPPESPLLVAPSVTWAL